MIGREVTPMRWWQNGSINAFTLSYKSGVLRLPPLTYTRTPLRARYARYTMKRLYASAHLWKERDVEAPPLYGKSPLWGIRLLVAKHRYIAFGVAQRGTLSSAYPPIQPYAPLFSSSRSLRTHARAHNDLHAAYIMHTYTRITLSELLKASHVFVTRINKIIRNRGDSAIFTEEEKWDT